MPVWAGADFVYLVFLCASRCSALVPGSLCCHVCVLLLLEHVLCLCPVSLRLRAFALNGSGLSTLQACSSDAKARRRKGIWRRIRVGRLVAAKPKRGCLKPLRQNETVLSWRIPAPHPAQILPLCIYMFGFIGSAPSFSPADALIFETRCF